jgi:hypothetical protein
MFEQMFDYGDGRQVTTKQLENHFYSTMQTVKEMISASFANHPKNRIFAFSGYFARFLLWLLALVSAFVGVLPVFDRLIGEDIAAAALPSLVAGMLMTALMAVLVHIIARLNVVRRILRLVAVLLICVLFLGLLLFIAVSSGVLLPMACAVAAGFFLLALSENCRRRTKLGDQLTERILGLRSFLQEAERERIIALVESDPAYFYNVLPTRWSWVSQTNGPGISPISA